MNTPLPLLGLPNRRRPALWAPALALALLLPVTAVAADDGSGGGGPSVAVHGFVDTSIYVPFQKDPDVLLGLDQVELDFEVAVSPGLTLRVDLNYFPAQPVTVFDDIVEQAYAQYYFGGGDEGFFLGAGKRNAPIGVEALDPVDMFQYSYGLLFSHATPSNLTGFFVGYEGSGVTAMVWATNDWDAPVTSDSASAGGRVAYDFGRGAVGLAGTYGPFEADDPLVMLDLDFVYRVSDLTLFLEGNFGRKASENSFGGLVKANYAFTDSESLTARFDYLDRPFDALDERSSAALAFLFGITEGFGAVVEVRADFAEWGEPDVGGAVELTASF